MEFNHFLQQQIDDYKRMIAHCEAKLMESMPAYKRLEYEAMIAHAKLAIAINENNISEPLAL